MKQRTLRTLVLALAAGSVLLLALAPAAEARPFVPRRTFMDSSTCSMPLSPGTEYCVESRGGFGDGRNVYCNGVWTRSEPAPDGSYEEQYVAACTDGDDPTNAAVCTGYERFGSDPPVPGSVEGYGYECRGYWNGCTYWREYGFKYAPTEPGGSPTYSPYYRQGNDPFGNDSPNCPFVD